MKVFYGGDLSNNINLLVPLLIRMTLVSRQQIHKLCPLSAVLLLISQLDLRKSHPYKLPEMYHYIIDLALRLGVKEE